MINFPRSFEENFHMSYEMFELLHSNVEKYLLPKRNTRIDAISTRQRLALALEYVIFIQ